MTGYVLKVRGGGAVREFRCPSHGVFETREPGDWQPCPWMLASSDWNAFPGTEEPCGIPSPRCFTAAPAVHTAFVVSAVRGKDDPKPHPRAMDLRPIAEGQSHQDWRKGRAAMWENERRKRVREAMK